MKKIFILLFSFGCLQKISAQDSSGRIGMGTFNKKITSLITYPDVVRYPYKTTFKTDAPIITIGAGLTYLGNNLIRNKKPLSVADLANKTRDKVPAFDRGNAGFYSDKINRDSYIPFLGSFAVPLGMLIFNKSESRNASTILVMYAESLSISSALFTMAAGTINRPRPLVYGTTAPTDQRINKNNQRSFYAGHTSTTATSTFFAAKVFQDLNPGSKATPYVWVIAAAVPAVVGYMRYQSGFHFLSDNLLGYVMGAASGILIPEWHKRKGQKNLSFTPQVGTDYNGVTFVYHIK